MQTLIKNPNQCEKCLEVLRQAHGGWINGRYFLQELGYSQYHARLKELQERGYKIVSNGIKTNGFYSYRLIEERMPSAFKPKVENFEERTRKMFGYA